MHSNEATVRDLFKTWGSGVPAIQASWRDSCSSDIVWWNSARGAVNGMDACLEALGAFSMLVGDDGYVEVPIKNLVVADDLVIVERSDNLYTGQGSLVASVPVVGVISFQGDQISEWRDYCNDWIRDFREQGDSRDSADLQSS